MFVFGLGRYDLRPEEVKLDQSILSQRKDPDLPELMYLGEALSRIRIYREWSLGRDSPLRLPQKPDLPNDFLQEDGKNLALVLNSFQDKLAVKRRVLDALQQILRRHNRFLRQDCGWYGPTVL